MTWGGNSMSAEWILSEVKGYKYISFDLYDTLLIRPYVKPKDLFRHMEKVYDAPGFAAARIRAEIQSRGSLRQETTFHRIYDFIPEEYRHLKRAELEFETRVYCPPHIRDCFNQLCKRHKVVILTDMYLPKLFIEGLLKKCGLVGYHRLYVSCEVNCNKASGRLFRRALFDLGAWAEEMIHIGDNVHSDYSVPRLQGIYAAHTKRPIDRYLKKHPLVNKFYRKDRSVERSIMVAMDMIHSFEKTDDFWYEAAFRFGGPLAKDYLDFVDKNRKEDDSVFFIARDGYNLKQIFDQMYPSARTEYVYAPRKLNVLIGSKYKKHKKYQEIIVPYLYPDFEGDPYEFFEKNKKEILKKRKELFNAYASRLGDHDKICLVDVTTMKYSSQKLISDLYPEADIHGVYYTILDDDPEYPHDGYHVRDKVVKLWDNINLTEFFLTSPEAPIEGIDSEGKPIFKEICDEERQRLDIYDSITQGEIDYCGLMINIFGEERLDFGYRNIRDWLKVLSSPLNSRSRRHLAEMKWPVDASHEKYVGMVYHPRDTWYHLRKTVLDSMWYISKRLKDED